MRELRIKKKSKDCRHEEKRECASLWSRREGSRAVILSPGIVRDSHSASGEEGRGERQATVRGVLPSAAEKGKCERLREVAQYAILKTTSLSCLSGGEGVLKNIPCCMPR